MVYNMKIEIHISLNYFVNTQGTLLVSEDKAQYIITGFYTGIYYNCKYIFPLLGNSILNN